MRRVGFAIVTMAAVCALAGSARAGDIGADKRVGVGLEAGAAPGLSAKAWVSRRNAVDFGLGIGLGDFACNDRFNPCGQRMSFNMDYLVHPGRGETMPPWIAVHLGLGARVWFYQYGQTAKSMDFAARVPIGVDLMIFQAIEAYAEVVPSLGFNPTLAFIGRERWARVCTCSESRAVGMRANAIGMRGLRLIMSAAMRDDESRSIGMRRDTERGTQA